MRKRLYIAAAVCLGLVLVGGAGVGFAWRVLNTPFDVPASGLLLEVSPGSSLAAVAQQLATRAGLKQPRLLTWYGRLRGDATRIHVGEYRVNRTDTPVSLLVRLVEGDVVLHQFTIVEGWRFEELLSSLRGHPNIAAGTATPMAIMAALGKPDLHPEGQFLPDTYSFPKGTTELDLLRLAHTALLRHLAEAWEARAPDLKLASPYEALILASIVEKETALESERPMIAGVFHRRLERGMRLQTDPTVIYGLGESFDGNLRRRDLTEDTPYNTYTRGGLPPTPIALAGRAAIDAAVRPAAGQELYFVATGDPDGSHRFSVSLEEHNRAVQDYLQRLRSGRD